jgi:hypothetical protein
MSAPPCPPANRLRMSASQPIVGQDARTARQSSGQPSAPAHHGVLSRRRVALWCSQDNEPNGSIMSSRFSMEGKRHRCEDNQVNVKIRSALHGIGPAASPMLVRRYTSGFWPRSTRRASSAVLGGRRSTHTSEGAPIDCTCQVATLPTPGAGECHSGCHIGGFTG